MKYYWNSIPLVDVVEDRISFCTVGEPDVIFNPVNKMVFERSFNNLVQEVW